MRQLEKWPLLTCHLLMDRPEDSARCRMIIITATFDKADFEYSDRLGKTGE